jgi:hypothetical protein
MLASVADVNPDPKDPYVLGLPDPDPSFFSFHTKAKKVPVRKTLTSTNCDFFFTFIHETDLMYSTVPSKYKQKAYQLNFTTRGPDPNPKPDPKVSGTDSRIQVSGPDPRIRIRTKISWVHNTASSRESYYLVKENQKKT